jgi:phosphatidylglycerophosphate synthase
VSTPEPIRRTAEIEEITNLYFIHPLASRLVPLFARMGLTPNAVSITGMLFGILAGLAYYHYQDLRFALAGLLLMIAWHVMDGADGQLARLTRSQSRLGQVLDGISDNVTFLAVYAGLAIALARRYGEGAYALVAAAALCHAVQSATYEAQRQQYERWGWGKRSPESARPHRLLDFLLHLFYGRLSFPAAGVTREFQARMSAALERQPGRAELLRHRYRETFAPLLRRWSLLSANYRTLGIFIAAALGAPQYYFGFEIVGLSAILALLIYAQSISSRAFFEMHEQTSAL